MRSSCARESRRESVGRERGREGGRERGREGERERGREGERKGERKGERGREGGRGGRGGRESKMGYTFRDQLVGDSPLRMAISFETSLCEKLQGFGTMPEASPLFRTTTAGKEGFGVTVCALCVRVCLCVFVCACTFMICTFK